MADIMFDWVDNNLVQGAALTVSTDRIGQKPGNQNDIRQYRQELRDRSYHFVGTAGDEELSVTRW